MWYKLLVSFAIGNHFMERYVYCNSKYDLYAAIGYIYSTCIEEIRRIDYKIVKEVDAEDDKIFSLRGRV